MKILSVIRHAKSSWKSPAASDHDRPLNGRGLRDGPIMAHRFVQRYSGVDILASSSAKRALSTARFFARELEIADDAIVVESGLYLAGEDDLLEFVRSQSADAKHIAFVAHNPGVTAFINDLSDLHLPNLPTCGVVHLQFDIDSWAQVDAEKAGDAFFDYPKKRDL